MAKSKNPWKDTGVAYSHAFAEVGDKRIRLYIQYVPETGWYEGWAFGPEVRNWADVTTQDERVRSPDRRSPDLATLKADLLGIARRRYGRKS